MIRKYGWFLCLVLAIGLLVSGAPARDDAKNEKRRAGSSGKPATVKVEKGTIKVEVSLKGVVEAEQMVPVSLKPEAWAMPLTVKKAVEHGTPVKKGDVLVEIDLEKIDRAIRDLKVDGELTEVTIRQAQEELPILEKTLPLDLALAERLKNQSDEDLKKFLEVDRPLSEASAEQSVKSAAFQAESAKEELKQLQKMYRSKDLTEETEEFILKRQRHAVESAEFFLKSAKIRRDQTLKVDLPRREQSLRENAVKQSLALEKAKNTLKLTASQKRLALQKLRYEYEKAMEKLGNLEKDREILTVRAPADGIAYHGKCDHGKWAKGGSRLQVGGNIIPAEVFMTLVTPRPVFVSATVEEKDLHLLRPDMKGKAVPTGYPDLKMPAKLVKVSSVPRTAGSFDAHLAIEAGKDAEVLMPGMACTVKLVPYQRSDALTVPASAVFTDDDDEDVRYVYLAGKGDGEPEKRTVKVGKITGLKAEILEGLQEGDEILANKPEKKKSSADSSRNSALEEK